MRSMVRDRNDSNETITCAFLSVALLIRLGANYLVCFWQADPRAGSITVRCVFLVREGAGHGNNFPLILSGIGVSQLLPLGFGHTAYDEYQRGQGVNPNRIIEPARDPLSGHLIWWRTRVRVSKA